MIETVNGKKFYTEFEQGYQQGRLDAINEILERANEIQREQIEQLNSSNRRNGKMWAMYMNTYLGHIQTACERMLKENGIEH